MTVVLVVLATLPLAVAVATFVAPFRLSRWLTVASGAASLALALLLVPAVTRGAVSGAGFLRVDALARSSFSPPPRCTP